jgi:hypothetical protein
MPGFKTFSGAALTVAGAELQRRIRKGQFALGRPTSDQTAPAIWNEVSPTSARPGRVTAQIKIQKSILASFSSHSTL